MARTLQGIKNKIDQIFDDTNPISGAGLYRKLKADVLETSFASFRGNDFENAPNSVFDFDNANSPKRKYVQNIIARTAFKRFNSKFKERTGHYYSKTFTYENSDLEGGKVTYTDGRVSGEGWFNTIYKLAKDDNKSNYEQSTYWTGFAEKNTNASGYKDKINDAFNLVLFKKYAEIYKNKTLNDLIREKQNIVEAGLSNKAVTKKKGNKFYVKKSDKNKLKQVLQQNYKKLCVIDALISLKGGVLSADTTKYYTFSPTDEIIKFTEEYFIKELNKKTTSPKFDQAKMTVTPFVQKAFVTKYFVGKENVSGEHKITEDDEEYLRIAAVDPKKVVSSVAPAAGGRGARGVRRRGIPSVAAPAAKAAPIVRYNLAKPVKDSRTDKLQTNILRVADGTDGTLAGTIKGATGYSRKNLNDGKYGRITQIAVLNSLIQLRTEILELIKKTEDDAPPAPPIVNEKRIIKLAKLLENKLLGESTNLLLEEEKVSKKELIEFAKKLKNLYIKFERQGGNLNQNTDPDEYIKPRSVEVSLVDEYNSILSNLVIKDRKIDYAASIKKIKAAEVKAAEDKAAAGAKGAVDAAGKRPLSVAPSQPYEVQCFNAKGTGSGESEMWEIDEAWSIATEGKMKFKPWYDLAMEIFKHNPQDRSFDYKRGRKAKYRAYLLSINTYRVAGDTLNVKCLPKFISPFVLQLFNDFIRARRMARKFEKAGNIKDLNQLKQDAKFFYSEDGKFESTFAYKVYKIGMDVVSFKNIEYLTQRQEKASKEDPNTPPPGAKGIKDARTTELIDQKLDAKLKALQGAENVKMGGLNTRSLPTQTTFNNKNYKLFTGK